MCVIVVSSTIASPASSPGTGGSCICSNLSSLQPLFQFVFKSGLHGGQPQRLLPWPVRFRPIWHAFWQFLGPLLPNLVRQSCVAMPPLEFTVFCLFLSFIKWTTSFTLLHSRAMCDRASRSENSCSQNFFLSSRDHSASTTWNTLFIFDLEAGLLSK